MNESRAFASLNPSLLARKGGAKPAMRPQIAPSMSPLATPTLTAMDDLGWNDMGWNEGEEPEIEQPAAVETPPAVEAAKPAVRQHLDAIAAHLARSDRVAARDVTEAAPKPARPQRQTAQQRRAAFTLRLDGDRHLKLRLASTIKNRSAQQIVTEALDRLLRDMPELDSLASQVRPER